MKKKPIVVKRVPGQLGSGPQIESSSGSIAFSPSRTGATPPAAANPMMGRLTSPRNMRVPWKTSDQTTATNPPLTM